MTGNTYCAGLATGLRKEGQDELATALRFVIYGMRGFRFLRDRDCNRGFFERNRSSFDVDLSETKKTAPRPEPSKGGQMTTPNRANGKRSVDICMILVKVSGQIKGHG